MPAPAERCRCCIVGGGPAGMMLGLPSRARRRRRDRAREARRLPPRFPRRHHPSLDARAHPRARPARRVPAPAAPGDAGDHGAWSATTELTLADFSHLPTRCRFIAFMPQWDFLDFLALHAQGLSRLRAAHAGRGHRPRRRRAGASSACARGRPKASSRSGPTSSSAPTAATRWCAKRPALRSRISARPWTRSGCAFRAARTTPSSRSAGSAPARSTSCSNRGDYWQCALVIPKGGFDGAEGARARGPARRASPRSRRSSPTASARCRAGTTSSC